jgi:DNA-directed RNA polymerase subunit RPC12/RpoP
MATKIVCQECGAQFDSRAELQNIVVNSAVQKTRKICPECESASGTFDTVEVEEEDDE